MLKSEVGRLRCEKMEINRQHVVRFKGKQFCSHVGSNINTLHRVASFSAFNTD